MEKSNKQCSKLKTLLVYQFLEKYSDDEHPLSTTELIEMLSKYGISCERKSIYADVKALNEIGCDIISVVSPKRGFFMASRRFDLPEVRLLIDAVRSAGFITPIKTKNLIEKLESLMSVEQAKSLVSQVYCEGENKCNNEEIYYVIDALHEAITKRKKVKFLYKRRNIDKMNKKNYTEKPFNVSPYALIWNDDNYYLVCNNEKYDNLMNLRLDRIRKINILEETARPVCEVSEYDDVFDSADYSSKMFSMFSGEYAKVKFLCVLSMREEIMDRFGYTIPLNAVDSNHFETTIDAAVSEGLVNWILQFGDEIKVIEPSFLVDMVVEKCKKIENAYK